MHAPIYYEVKVFLEAHRDLTAKDLAISAGIHPTILTKVLSERRRDMWSSNAEPLCVALSANLGPQPRLKLPTNKKRSFMLSNVLIALGVVIVVAFIFSPAR